MSEFRINQRQARQHQRAAQADFDPVFGRGQHRVAGHLGAGAGRGRDGDVGSGGLAERLPPADDFQIVEGVATVGQQGGDGLACVQGAPPTESDDQIAVRLTRLLGTQTSHLGGRLTSYGEGDGFNPLCIQGIEQRRGARSCAARHHQGPAPHFRRQRPDLAQRAGSEDDARGSGKLEAPVLSGVEGHLPTPNPDHRERRWRT